MSAQLRDGCVYKRLAVAMALAGSGVIVYYSYKKWNCTRPPSESPPPALPLSSAPQSQRPAEETKDGESMERGNETREAELRSPPVRPTVTIGTPPPPPPPPPEGATGSSDVSLTDSFEFERVYMSVITPPIAAANGDSMSSSFEAISKSQIESQISQQLRDAQAPRGSTADSKCEDTGGCSGKEESGCEPTASKRGSGDVATGTADEEKSLKETTTKESDRARHDVTEKTPNVTNSPATPTAAKREMEEKKSRQDALGGSADTKAAVMPEYSPLKEVAPRVLGCSPICVSHPDDRETRVELGMNISTVEDSTGKHHVVEDVQAGSVATQLGLRNGARLLKLNGMSVDRWSHNALVDQFSAINVETIETTFTAPNSMGKHDCIEVTAGIYVENDLVCAKVSDVAARTYVADNAAVTTVTANATLQTCLIENRATGDCLHFFDGKLSAFPPQDGHNAFQFSVVSYDCDRRSGRHRRSTCLFVASQTDESCFCLTVLDQNSVSVEVMRGPITEIEVLKQTDARFFFIRAIDDDVLFESTELPGRYLAIDGGRVFMVKVESDPFTDSRLRHHFKNTDQSVTVVHSANR